MGSSPAVRVSLGYGGPHAGFLATLDGEHKRRMPGRLVGVSRMPGPPPLRLAPANQEQRHPARKRRAALHRVRCCAVNGTRYAVYQGPKGLQSIARRIHRTTCQACSRAEEKAIGPCTRPFLIRFESGWSAIARTTWSSAPPALV